MLRGSVRANQRECGNWMGQWASTPDLRDVRMPVAGERHFAMRIETETAALEEIAEAFRTISKEISYQGLANALLEAALSYSGVTWGAVLLSEGGEMLTKADANFSREGAEVF